MKMHFLNPWADLNNSQRNPNILVIKEPMQDVITITTCGVLNNGPISFLIIYFIYFYFLPIKMHFFSFRLFWKTLNLKNTYFIPPPKKKNIIICLIKQNSSGRIL